MYVTFARVRTYARAWQRDVLCPARAAEHVLPPPPLILHDAQHLAAAVLR